MPEMPEKTQLINVQTRNFNRHIMTAKTQNTYIYLHNYCPKMPENAGKCRKTPELICTQKRYFNSSKK
jgi:hypothetical protein